MQTIDRRAISPRMTTWLSAQRSFQGRRFPGDDLECRWQPSNAEWNNDFYRGLEREGVEKSVLKDAEPCSPGTDGRTSSEFPSIIVPHSGAFAHSWEWHNIRARRVLIPFEFENNRGLAANDLGLRSRTVLLRLRGAPLTVFVKVSKLTQRQQGRGDALAREIEKTNCHVRDRGRKSVEQEWPEILT